MAKTPSATRGNLEAKVKQYLQKKGGSAPLRAVKERVRVHFRTQSKAALELLDELVDAAFDEDGQFRVDVVDDEVCLSTAVAAGAGAAGTVDAGAGIAGTPTAATEGASSELCSDAMRKRVRDKLEDLILENGCMRLRVIRDDMLDDFSGAERDEAEVCWAILLAQAQRNQGPFCLKDDSDSGRKLMCLAGDCG